MTPNKPIPESQWLPEGARETKSTLAERINKAEYWLLTRANNDINIKFLLDLLTDLQAELTRLSQSRSPQAGGDYIKENRELRDKIKEYHEMIQEADADYIRLMKQKAGGEWISVSERLPEYTCRAGSDSFVFVIGNTQIGVKEVMYCNDKWLSFGNIQIPVTHWMPLPSPPEPRTKEGG